MKRIIIAVLASALVALAGCASDTKSESASAVTKTVTETAAPSSAPVTETETAVPVAPPTQAVPAAPVVQTWTMPDMAGLNLQDAQDGIQALTTDAIFFTDSVDASGQGRMQVIDSNWKVCAQTPAPGTLIDKSATITFAAVKIPELCP